MKGMQMKKEKSEFDWYVLNIYQGVFQTVKGENEREAAMQAIKNSYRDNSDYIVDEGDQLVVLPAENEKVSKLFTGTKFTVKSTLTV
jgi:hypothetical protein